MGAIRPLKIKSVVDRINESYFVPDIQRSYVWLQNPKLNKIEQLFDSLMRGYPIGSLLIWRLRSSDIDDGQKVEPGEKEKLNFQLYKFIGRYDVRKSHNEKVLLSEITSNELNIVLDGQQRLTSLYIGLRGSRCLKRPYSRANAPEAYEEKFLYLDLSHVPSEDNPDDCYRFEFITHEKAKADLDERKAKWFYVHEVMKFENQKSVWEYITKHDLTVDEGSVLMDLYRVICTEDNLSYYEEEEKSLDKVLKIFIRVNSGGMQLSYSDLLMSLLTATFQTEIRERMERQVDYLRDSGFACMGRDQILKTCLLLSKCNHVFKLENFRKENIRKIENNWSAIVHCINKSVDLLKTLGYENSLSSGYIISVIAFYLFEKGVEKVGEDDMKSIGDFVRVAQMRSFFSTGLDSKLSKINDILPSCNNFSDFLSRSYTTFENFKINDEYIEWAVENVQYGGSAVLPLLQALYPNYKYGEVKFHIDHIYPKSKFSDSNRELPEGYKKKANFIYNLQILNGVLNEEKNAQNPEEWLKRIYPQEEMRRNYLKDNYIPETFVLLWENLPDFERERKKLIIDKLKKEFATYK